MRRLTLCTGRLWAAQGRRGSAVVALRLGFPARPRLGFPALQVVAQGRGQAVLSGSLGRLGHSGPGGGVLGVWLVGRHRGPLAKLLAELADAGPEVNRGGAPPVTRRPRRRSGGRPPARPSGAERRGYPGG